MPFLFGLFFGLACIEDIKRTAQEFPDNQRHDYDNDGLSEFDGDCDDLNANITGPSLWYADADGDGFGDPLTEVESCQSDLLDLDKIYVDEGTDCDDDNPEVHPDMLESCDGVDNNCDDEVDNYMGSDAPRWFADADGDGYGDVELSFYACTQPPLYVLDSSDCDDSNADAYPNAPEYCDGIDTNCNGIEDDNTAIDAIQWYTDVDGDGFGVTTTVLVQCAQPSGFVLNATDCNDFSTEQYPGADEQCNEQDDNCDGQVDEGVLSDFYLDADGDGYGDISQLIRACSVPPGTSENSDDCNDGSALVRPEATEICNNIDDDCDGYVDNNAVGTSEYFPDNDGDGHGEPSNPLISCPSFDPSTGLPVAPNGYSLFDDDCDDTNPSRAPSLPELCTDTVDENCDGDTTIGATDITVWYADSDGDGQGNPVYTVSVCNVPFGYVTNSDDCNDTDPDVLLGMPVGWEICNGKLDRCEDDDGNLTLQDIELDDDGDGYVDCALDVDPLQWADLSAGILGGGDCEDDDIDAYPGAPEICNGVVENFSGDGSCTDPLPFDESDDDFDGYVECGGYDSFFWEGDVSVIGGSDCNDDRPNAEFTYPGSTGDPNICAQDADRDGLIDCVFSSTNTVQPAPSTYFCDLGLFLNADIGPDFVLIPAGNDPLGRYSISFDFYMMTTEVTYAIWDAVMGSGSSTASSVKTYVSWYDAALFANSLSVMGGEEECYSCSGSYPYQSCTEAIDPTLCEGYRLPTEWEWEYAARSGTTSDFWTGEGPELGGTYSSDTCNGTEMILDGVSNPLLSDYMWYCGNTSYNQEVAQKLPNGFGLYGMHGNISEWTIDLWSSSHSPSGDDPWNGVVQSQAYRYIRGSNYNGQPSHAAISADRFFNSPTYSYYGLGFRLIKKK